MNSAAKDLKEILYDEEKIKARVKELGAQISDDYRGLLEPGESLLVVCMLRGAFLFMADLVREIDVHCEIDFMRASSYGGSTESSGRVAIKEEAKDIFNRHVLIVEDIVDTGNTMTSVLELLSKRKPKSLALCTLLDKPSRRGEGIEVKIDYCGFTVDNEFVVGYGLDYDSRYRNLPFIGILKPEIYTKKTEI